jgi:multiple sugar transport system substrate-binding protein
MRLGNEHVMGVYVIWKFAKNKEAAQKYLVDQQLSYREHFVRSKYYNFPPWTGSIPGGFKTIRSCGPGPHKPKGKYTVLTTIAEKYTTNPAPREHDAGDGRDLQHVPHPADVRPGGTGEGDPEEAVSAFAKKAQASTASGGPGPRVTARLVDRRGPPATGPSLCWDEAGSVAGTDSCTRSIAPAARSSA